jgi:hypothetical protein
MCDTTRVQLFRDLEKKYTKKVYPTAVDGYSLLSWLGYTRIFGGVTSISHASYVIFFLFLQFGEGRSAPSQWAEDYALVAPATSWLVIAVAILWLVWGLLARFDKYAEAAKKAFYWSLGIQGFTALIGMGSILTNLWCATPRPPGKWWKKVDLEAQGARQSVNKGGMFMTGMLSIFMLLLAPVLGAKRMVELCKPVLELFKQIPYATWMCDWLHDWWNGKVDFDDLPEDHNDEVRKYAKKVYGDYMNAQREYAGEGKEEPHQMRPHFPYYGVGTHFVRSVDTVRVVRFDIKQTHLIRLEDLVSEVAMKDFQLPFKTSLFGSVLKDSDGTDIHAYKTRVFDSKEEFLTFLKDENGPFVAYCKDCLHIPKPSGESIPIPEGLKFNFSHISGGEDGAARRKAKLEKVKVEYERVCRENPEAFVESDESSEEDSMEVGNPLVKILTEDEIARDIVREKECVDLEMYFQEAQRAFEKRPLVDETPEKLTSIDLTNSSSSTSVEGLEPQCYWYEEEEVEEMTRRAQVRQWKDPVMSPRQYWSAFMSLFYNKKDLDAVMKAQAECKVSTAEMEKKLHTDAYNKVDVEVDKAKERADQEALDEMESEGRSGFFDYWFGPTCEWWTESNFGQAVDEKFDDYIVEPYEKVTDYFRQKWKSVPMKGRKVIKVAAFVTCLVAFMWMRSRDSTDMDEQKAGWNLNKGGRAGKKNRRQQGGPRRNFGKKNAWDYSEGVEDHPENFNDNRYEHDEYGRMDGQASGPVVPDVVDDSKQQRAIFKSKKLRIRVDTQDYLKWLNESRQSFQRQLETKKLVAQSWKPDDLSGGVYKIYDESNNYLCTGTLVADQMFVVMHALSEDLTKTYYARNHVHSITMRAKTLSVHNDHIASFKVSGFATPFKAHHMRPLKESSIVTVFGYGDGACTRPDVITGFASPTGWCTAATRKGDCTSPVLDKDGFVVGFWTHGDGDQFGRFEIVTSELVNFMKQVKPVTHSGLDFQSRPRSLNY